MASSLRKVLRPRSGIAIANRLAIALALASLAPPAWASPWVPLGPEGGVVWGLGVDPTDPAVVYAGTDGSGIFKSRDGGWSWSLLAGSFAGYDYPYEEILVDPAEPANVYARTSFLELFKSDDAGATWRRISDPFPNEGHAVYDLEIDPTASSHLLAASFDGPYESFDGGESWQPVADFPLDPNSPAPSRAGVSSLAVDPVDPRILYATTSPFGVLKSTDGGASWEPATTGVSPTLIADRIVIASGDPSRLYLFTILGGLYRSTDAGATWQPLQPGLEGVITHLEVDPVDAGLLHAVVYQRGLFRSENGGRNWSRIDAGITGGIHAFARGSGDPQVLHAGSDDGPWRSTDGGDTWRLRSRGFAARQIRSVAATAGEARAVLAGSEDGAILRREVDGNAWSRVFPPPPAPLSGTQVTGLATSPADPARAYAAIGYGLFESRDGGLTWSPLPLPDFSFPVYFSAVIPDPTDAATLYAAGTQVIPFSFDPSVLIKTTDGGGTWTSVVPAFDFYVSALTIDPTAPQTLYAGGAYSPGNRGLLKSGDGGESWQDLSDRFPGGDPEVLSLALDASSSPSRLYAGLLEGGLYRSTDGGESWTAGGGGLPAGPISTLVLGSGSPAALYAVVSGHGVFRSTDGGETWASVGEGLPAAVLDLALLPTDPPTLFAATPSGVYRTTDAECAPGPTALCLQGGRFRVEVDWRIRRGRAGVGRAVPLTGDTGAFWFFDPANLELAVKVLDGRAINGHFWVFFGGLSNVAFELRVTDVLTGTARTYRNPRGSFASQGDTRAFAAAGDGALCLSPGSGCGNSVLTSTESVRLKGGGAAERQRGHPRGARTRLRRGFPPTRVRSPVGALRAGRPHPEPPPPTERGTGHFKSDTRLSLLDDRFQVAVAWTDGRGRRRTARARPLTGDSGAFWFAGPDNLELLVKAHDGRPVNGHFWFFYASLSNLGFEITVTDTETGAQRTYTNPAGTFASRGDTRAF